MQIKLINTQKVLAPTQINIAPYTINPYRGCEFGCLYCYVQENKNIKDSSRYVGIKINAPSVLAKELSYKSPKRVLLGTTTECFQYKERKYKITQKILELLNKDCIPYTILTKSHLIKEYLPLISKNKQNKIYFTFNISRNDLIKLLEENTPNLESRIDVIRAIIEHGIPLRIHIGPFIPYICSIKEIVALLPQEVREINVELYHHTMGNYEAILKRIEKNLGNEARTNIEYIYATGSNYTEFTKKLKEELNTLKNVYRKDFFLIIPDYNKFYTPNLDYKDKLLG